MTKIRFYIVNADAEIERRYVIKYSQSELFTTTDPSEAATFTIENNGYHRASVFHAIMQQIVQPLILQIEIIEEN